jgi:hypothetical protein
MSHKSIEVHVDYAMLAMDIMEDRPNKITDLLDEPRQTLDREDIEMICEDQIESVVQDAVKREMADVIKRIERIETWMREGYRTVLHSDAPEA